MSPVRTEKFDLIIRDLASNELERWSRNVVTLKTKKMQQRLIIPLKLYRLKDQLVFCIICSLSSIEGYLSLKILKRKREKEVWFTKLEWISWFTLQ